MNYPDLTRAKKLAFDIETYDPNLTELGPGVYRGDGRILGVSLSDGEGFKEYYNFGHYDCSREEQMHDVAYVREQLGSPHSLKIGQNILYDIDWLENGEHKIAVAGQLASTDIAEALLDENQGKYNLDFLGKKYLGRGKAKSGPERFCEEHKFAGDFRKWLWKMPYDLVREYAVDDAEIPVKVHDIQAPMLEAQELSDLYKMECDLIRCLLLFRKTGVYIDQDRRDRNGLMVQNRIELLQQALFGRYGEFNCNSTLQLAKVYDEERVRYPYSVLYKGASEPEKGVYRTPEELSADSSVVRFSPNIDDHFFTRFKDKDGPDGFKVDAPEVVKKTFMLRQCKSHLDKFILGSHVRFVGPDGKIHCSFYNMRNDEYGTRSGRLSSANPNLQQQPSKGVDEYWGQICREDFVPYPDCWWGKCDYSQIEYRFLAHFALGPGSDELRAAYRAGKTDYHQYIMDLTGLKRRYAKNLNFGVAFGMGARHMAELFGWELDYCYEVLHIYHSRAPYVKSTIDAVSAVAKRRGYIKTFLKRRSHLIDKNKAYIMFCRLLQGSAADLMKAAMLQCYNDGVFDVLYPHVTVHDEIDVSVPKTKVGVEAFREMQRTMETCIKIAVPIVAEPEIGDNWADVKEFDWKELEAKI
jgi:DNA polymerase I-like protein with 3'-5' exonuclease and polymerase domains